MLIPVVISTILKIAPVIIPLVERIIPIPKSGKDKMSLASQITRVILDKIDAMTNTQVNPGEKKSITDDELIATLETMFQQLSEGKALTAEPANPDLLYLIRGTITPLAMTPTAQVIKVPPTTNDPSTATI